ncbi:MAG: radical SAM protein [Anaerolineae bacterium]|nr:radical SAM protein [Anaerolineae bacterium]
MTPGQLPSYVALHQRGELAHRAAEAWALLAHCELCPHRCGVDRLSGELGRCRSGVLPKVASWNLHAWEEPPISGSRGSGTVFFSGCTGRCRFCQNYPISQLGVGRTVSNERLAEMMLELQRKGAHNINFVTPTHYVPAILGALLIAVEGGLRLPLVYNSSGFERVETLRLLEDVVDIWLPDAKYDDDEVALRLSGFPGYVSHNRAALTEMLRQVGPKLSLDGDGIARRGMIVRHLVLPAQLAGTAEVMGWIAGALSQDVHVSLMAQYFPAYECVGDAVLGCKITEAEYEDAVAALLSSGLENGWVQEYDNDACDGEV